MKELITREYKGIGVHFELINGESYVSVEDVAKFCGWTQIAKSGNEVIRWERVREKLELLGIPNVGHGGFIPENIITENSKKITKYNELKGIVFLLTFYCICIDYIFG